MENEKQPINDTEQSVEGTINEAEVESQAKENDKWYFELRNKIKTEVMEFVSTKPLSFRQVRELYLDLGRELEDVFFDQRIQMLVEELDKRYQKQ